MTLRMRWQAAIVLGLAAALVLLTVSVAPGSDWLSPDAAAVAPYEYGPVIHSDWLVPVAPYTEPYETGPVIKSDWLK